MSRLGAVRRIAGLALVAATLAGCSDGRLLANDPLVRPSPPATPAPTLAVADPVPIVFPRDDGPHGRLTEWWYYTGHLRDRATGDRFGFEYVVFRAERGDFPVSWAAHVALTDETRGRFAYAQRSAIGPQVDASPRAADGTPEGFALAVSGFDPSRPETAALPPWTMTGGGGHDRLVAAVVPADGAAGSGADTLSLDLELTPLRPPVLHDRDGYVDFGPAGGSYYYSRTRLDATGTLTLDGRQLAVEGTAWFDHQWGDFISVGAGGWDWFAVNLDDGTDVTLSLVRAADGSYPLAYGTLVGADGTAHHLDRNAFRVESDGAWTSPRTGIRYPAGWRISIPGHELTIELTPTVADQELDTRATTGVVYWEGSQEVRATRATAALGGEAYVELTGYGAGP